MKKYLIAAFLIGVFIILSTCKKNPDIDIDQFELTDEVVSVQSNSATIRGVYSYPKNIKEISLVIADNEQFTQANTIILELEDHSFTVKLTDLKNATTYHYYYAVNFGFQNPYHTETMQFTILGDTPTVVISESNAVNENTYRIQCEVLSDGGYPVTERGICWSTHNNPTLDDATLQHTEGGSGPYILHLENLDFDTRYYIRAYAKNTLGVSFSDELVIKTDVETVLPTVITTEINEITWHSALCVGDVTSDGGAALIERGVCWSTNPQPVVSMNHTVAEGNATGTFSVAIEDLALQTRYYVRCYAINKIGIAYGDELTFTTDDGLPKVNTIKVTNVIATNATSGGNVIDEGASSVIERGICWGTDSEPTINGTHAQNGAGPGTFTIEMTELTPYENYYVRAYATNQQGTAYGDPIPFTTVGGQPILTTSDITNITSNSARSGGTITDNFNLVSRCGICWSTHPNPNLNDNYINSVINAETFILTLSNLAPNTKYYVRAFAINPQGTGYGEQKEFTTSAK